MKYFVNYLQNFKLVSIERATLLLSSLFQKTLQLKLGHTIQVLCFALLIGCKTEPETKNQPYSTEPVIIAQGEKIFNQQCSACHGFLQDGIGPSLGGITHEVESNWIIEFIKSPKTVLDSDDDRAKSLNEKYVTLMPDFGHLKEEEINALLSFLHTKEKAPQTIDSLDQTPLKNPIKTTIPLSKSAINLKMVAQIPASHDTLPKTRINKLSVIPDSDRLMVNDLRGELWEVTPDGPVKYLDIREFFSDFTCKVGLGTGFGSFTFHPSFKKNGLFYTTHTEKSYSKPADFLLPDSVKVRHQWVLTEWKADMPKDHVFNGKKREVMRFDFIASAHAVQEIAFNPYSTPADADYGKLYIAVGDGASVQVGHPYIAIHHGTAPWGSILRIDPLGTNAENGKYGIPEDNPFVSNKGIMGEIWAYGFRNPNRISWYDKTRILATDIGQANIEELNLVIPGGFYGWPLREGTFLFNPKGNFNNVYPVPEDQKTDTIIDPILQYDHDEGAAISGGFMLTNLGKEKKYLFGDIPTGRIFLGDLNNGKIKELNLKIENEPITLTEATKSNRVDLKYGMGHNGQIYIFTKADGKIYQVLDIK
ncbi:c-type cytochrome [Muricauda sp. TY007]|uniref:PQQ-dependent sugar dehydrogenase n=1 Tax=Allomuricauda sp. TY007 TaxID=2683200 RepID=UPI0013BEE1F5|nr:PQQ-dependent sugar dehydrogenase [Muricauda sp. TY007]NDV16930.1 c-type cytochrome [Muricauda sp. TY007]